MFQNYDFQGIITEVPGTLHVENTPYITTSYTNCDKSVQDAMVSREEHYRDLR